MATNANANAEPETPVYLGHYRIEKTLGQGSYGKVKLATNTKTNQKVALKFILKSNIKKPVHMTRIKREVRLLKLLNHPNIVRLYEVAETNQEIILTMEHAGGGELFDYIVAQHRLKEKEARKLFRQIISAVDYCHSNCVIHRDLKPENLLLDADKNIKIIDFGFANMFDPDGLMGTFCGSPFYASPEMILGKKYVGPEVDIWSLGVILFALLCGHLPFDDSNMKKLYNKIIEGKFITPEYVSAGAKDLIGKMIVIDPLQRAKLEDVKNHPWLSEEYSGPPNSLIPSRPIPSTIDEAVIAKLSTYGFDADTVRQKVVTDSKGPAFATYYLILEKALREEEAKKLEAATTAEKVEAPPVKEKPAETEAPATEEKGKRRARTLTGNDAGKWQAVAMNAISNTKNAPNTTAVHDKEHESEAAVGRRKQSEVAIKKEEEPVASGNEKQRNRRYSADNAQASVLNAAAAAASKYRNKNEEKSGEGAEASGQTTEENEEDLQVVKGLFNVSTTSNKSPEEIIQEVGRVLTINGVKYTLNSHIFTCQDISTGALIKFEIEVCKIQRLSLFGLHLKRLEGDTWSYKRLCHKITSQLRI